MDLLKEYMESRSEGVLRLLEGGKRRGIEELRKGNGRGTQKELFEAVVVSQHAFLELHHRCVSALRFANTEEIRDIALDVQYLLFIFSRQVYELAFVNQESDESPVSFPPPEAYSRHYPGDGPDAPESLALFKRYFGDTVYSNEKSNVHYGSELDRVRTDRMKVVLKQSNHH